MAFQISAIPRSETIAELQVWDQHNTNEQRSEDTKANAIAGRILATLGFIGCGIFFVASIVSSASFLWGLAASIGCLVLGGVMADDGDSDIPEDSGHFHTPSALSTRAAEPVQTTTASAAVTNQTAPSTSTTSVSAVGSQPVSSASASGTSTSLVLKRDN